MTILEIVHGDVDETVPVAEALALHRDSRHQAELLLVSGAAYTYGVTHGMRVPTPEISRSVARTIDFLQAALR